MTTYYAFTCNTPNADLRLIIQHGLDYTRDHIGIEPGADNPRAPQQLRLI